MILSPETAPEEFAETREHEFQDPHFHDEDLEILNEEAPRRGRLPLARRKSMRLPPRRRRYAED